MAAQFRNAPSYLQNPTQYCRIPSIRQSTTASATPAMADSNLTEPCDRYHKNGHCSHEKHVVNYVVDGKARSFTNRTDFDPSSFRSRLAMYEKEEVAERASGETKYEFITLADAYSKLPAGPLTFAQHMKREEWVTWVRVNFLQSPTLEEHLALEAVAASGGSIYCTTRVIHRITTVTLIQPGKRPALVDAFISGPHNSTFSSTQLAKHIAPVDTSSSSDTHTSTNTTTQLVKRTAPVDTSTPLDTRASTTTATQLGKRSALVKTSTFIPHTSAVRYTQLGKAQYTLLQKVLMREQKLVNVRRLTAPIDTSTSTDPHTPTITVTQLGNRSTLVETPTSSASQISTDTITQLGKRTALINTCTFSTPRTPTVTPSNATTIPATQSAKDTQKDISWEQFMAARNVRSQKATKSQLLGVRKSSNTTPTLKISASQTPASTTPKAGGTYAKVAKKRVVSEQKSTVASPSHSQSSSSSSKGGSSSSSEGISSTSSKPFVHKNSKFDNNHNAWDTLKDISRWAVAENFPPSPQTNYLLSHIHANTLTAEVLEAGIPKNVVNPPTFHFFMELAGEIQNSIINYAWINSMTGRGRQVVLESECTVGNRETFQMGDGFRTISPTPALFHVCRSFRSFMIGKYENRFNTSHAPHLKTWVNLSRDQIFLLTKGIHQLSTMVRLMTKHERLHMLRLALPLRDVMMDADRVVENVAKFLNLQSVELIYGSSYADMSCVPDPSKLENDLRTKLAKEWARRWKNYPQYVARGSPKLRLKVVCPIKAHYWNIDELHVYSGQDQNTLYFNKFGRRPIVNLGTGFHSAVVNNSGLIRTDTNRFA